MVIYFSYTLSQALKSIEHSDKKTFHLHTVESFAQHSKELIDLYGEIKWKIVDLLNTQYSQVLSSPFDLYNWLYDHEHDEVAHFLNETGSNVLSYSEFKMPCAFHLFLGKKGFVIGIEQKGCGFNAKEVDEKKIKENEGAAFNFYRKAKSKIFFDEPANAKIVYCEYLF